MCYYFFVYGVWGYGLIVSVIGSDVFVLVMCFLLFMYVYIVIMYCEVVDIGVFNFGVLEFDVDLSWFFVECDMMVVVVLL